MPHLSGVGYDFEAAQDLSRACQQLAGKVAWLVWTRGPNSTRFLDDQPGSWTGAKRETFNRDRAAENRALSALADQARALAGRVDAATENATAEARKLLFDRNEK